MLLKQVVCPVLVGRQSELQAIAHLLDEAVAGRGETLLLGGDAGIGKSRLCREIKREAATRGVRVLEGRCSSAESSVPYGPFMDALRFRLARGEGKAAAQLLGPLIKHLAPLLPELSGDRSLSSAESRAAAERPFESIFQVVHRLAELGPLVFILEDVHWADPTSRELLHYLSRRIRSVPVLVVATYRTDELHVRHPVRRLVATMTRERLAREIVLAPLTQTEVGEMVGAIIGDSPEQQFVRVVRQRTEGNPFFVEELLKGLADAGRLNGSVSTSDLERAELPLTVSETVLARVEPLGDRAHEVLSVAAVIGRRFDFDLLRAVSGVAEDELLGIVEQLVQHQILVEERTPSGECFAFRHVLMQEVLYNDILARRRRVIHRRVAAVLEEHPPEELPLLADALAYHYNLGGDDVRARKYSVLAGDQASRLYAWEDAEARYERALAALEGVAPDPTLEADVLEKLAFVTWWQGRADDSLQYANDALALRRTLGDRRSTASVLRHLGLLHAYQRGSWEQALGCVREALALLSHDPDAPELARAANDLGRLLLALGEVSEAEHWLEQALSVARRSGEPAEEAFALAKLGHLDVLSGVVARGTERLERARVLMRPISMPLDRATGIYNAGVRAFDAAHDHRRLIEWLDEGAQYAERHGVAANMSINRAFRALAEHRMGHWSTALELARTAVDELRQTKRIELREALRILGDLHLESGDVAAASTAYDEAASLGDRAVEIGRARLLMRQDRPPEAAERFGRILRQLPPGQHLLAVHVLACAVEAYLHAERFADAVETLEQLQERVERIDYAAGHAELMHTTGLVAAASGDLAAAERAFEEAAEAWGTLEHPFHRARSRLHLARVLLDGDDQRGTAIARESLALFESIGADVEAAMARRMLRRAGVRVRTRPAQSAAPADAPAHGLTARELSVLTELSKGYTNKEIARALGITEKTVSIHVSHILAKLACATRTQAASTALELNLVARPGLDALRGADPAPHRNPGSLPS